MTTLLMERAARTRSSASPAVRRNTAIATGSILLFILVHIILHPLYIPPDAALHLQCGMLLIEGQAPYRDFFDVAAPMLMYVNILPALASKVIPLHPVFIFNLYTLMLVSLSIALSAAMLFQTRMREQLHVPLFIIGLAVANVLCLHEFGQRDHLFLVFFMPFLVCHWLSSNRLQPRRLWAIAAGVSGGIAICLDPLYLLVFVGMELFFILSKQSVRFLFNNEMKAVLATIGIYLLSLMFLPKEALDVYIHWALPMVLCGYKYWNDNISYFSTSPDRRDLVYLMVLGSVIGLGLRRFCSLIPPVVAISIIGFGLFVIQGALYSHEALSMAFGATMAGILSVSVAINLAIKAANLKTEKLFSTPVVGTVCAIAFVALSFYSYLKIKDSPTIDLSTLGYWGSAPKADLGDYSEILEENTKPGDGVVFLNYRVRHGYPVTLQLARKPGVSLLWGFPIRMAKLMPEREPYDQSRDYKFWADQMFARLIADIKERKPKAILIDFDSFDPVLTENKVIEAIEPLYLNKGVVDGTEHLKDHPEYDYVGFRNGYRLYVLKTPEDLKAEQQQKIEQQVQDLQTKLKDKK